MSIQLTVTTPARDANNYPIFIGAGVSNQLIELVDSKLISKKIVIISDETVASLYAQKIQTIFINHGCQVKVITFPAGEENKSAATKLLIEEQMFAFGCDRHTLCVALGGGVVGDMVGFVAATYMRGINFIQVPSSLLAMIDSSVGGKTAVNTSYGKNIIGAFWQPKAVIMDTDLLTSLPREHVINGFFEAVKIFLTFDNEFVHKALQYIEAGLVLDKELSELIRRAVALKAYVVEVDEFERNLRMILNFGHTVGHALEKLTHYEVLHGFAVGYGMLVEAKIAQLVGELTEADFVYLEKLLAKLDIKADFLQQFDGEAIVQAMRGDKKNKDQQISLVLLNGIGSVKNIDNKVAFPVAEEIIKQAINELKV